MAALRQQPQPIIGRERELARLRELFDRLASGRGAFVLISGEAGIGKTTLVNDLAGHAEAAGGLVLVGGCYDRFTNPPYGPLIEAFRDAEPASDDPLPPEFTGRQERPDEARNQATMFNELHGFIAALSARQPLVLIQEDLHWTDAATVDALRYLARSLSSEPVLVIATYRDDEPEQNRYFFGVLPLLARESGVARIDLRRWEAADTSALIANRYDIESVEQDRLTSYVHELAQGNPFHSDELLRTLEGNRLLARQRDRWQLGDLSHIQVPPLIRIMINQRMDYVSQDTIGLLRVAATIGQWAPVDLWLRIAGVSADQLDQAITEATSANIADAPAGDQRLRFRHALIREAIYDDIPTLRRQALHKEIAEALIEASAPDPDVVAHHLERGGDDQVLEWLLRSGDRAQRDSAWITASERFLAVADRLASDPARAQEQAWLTYHAGTLVRFSDNRYSASLIERAGQLASQAGDRDLEARSRAHLGANRCHQGNVGAGLEDIEAGLAMMDSIPWSSRFVSRPDDVDDALQAMVRTLAPDTFDREFESVLDLTDPRMSPRNIWIRRVLTNWLSQAGRYQEALALEEERQGHLAQLAAVAESDLRYLANAHPGLALGYEMLGFPERAMELYERGIPAAEVEGDYFASAISQFVRLQSVVLPYYTDDLGMRHRAVAELERTAKLAEEQTRPLPMHRFGQTLVDLVEGRWEQARSLEPLLERVGFSILKQAMVPHFGELDRVQGRTAAAWQKINTYLAAGSETTPGKTLFKPAVALQRLAIKLLLDAGEFDEAWQWLTAHDSWLEWSQAVRGRADGQLLWARYHRLAGDDEQARQSAQLAQDHATAPRQPQALIATDRFLGVLDLDAGRTDDATIRLDKALALARSCLMPYEEALALIVQAELELASNQPDQARQRLDNARSKVGRLQAIQTLERIDHLDSQLAILAGGYPGGLSAREVDVLRQVAMGKTDAETAESLYIGRRTVTSHLTSIYNKLGVNNRTEATRWAVENGLVTN